MTREGKGKHTDHVTTTGGGGSRERSDIKLVIFGKFIELLFTSWNREDHTIHISQRAVLPRPTVHQNRALKRKIQSEESAAGGTGEDFLVFPRDDKMRLHGVCFRSSD